MKMLFLKESVGITNKIEICVKFKWHIIANAGATAEEYIIETLLSK